MRRAIFFLTALTLAGCDTGTATPESMRATLLLTDAPGDVEAVWVDILHAYVRGDGEDIDLLDGPTGLIELTALAEAPTTLADGVDLPPGDYREIRFVIGDAVLETMDGEVFSKDGTAHPDPEKEATGLLHCPSCSQSGLKVKLPETLHVDDGAFVIVADFDVSQSFGKERGASDRWVMHPVIHAALASGGTVSGTVALAEGVTLPECPAGTTHGLDAFVPTATAATLVDGDGAAVVRSGHAEADGTLSIEFLSPDTYALGHVAEVEVADHVLTLAATVVPADATLAVGDVVDGVEYTITGATCTPPA